MLRDEFTEQDQSSGVIPRRFVYFVEKYVLNVLVAAGKKYWVHIIGLILDHHFPLLDGVPHFSKSADLVAHEARLSGFLFISCEVPFVNLR